MVHLCSPISLFQAEQKWFLWVKVRFPHDSFLGVGVEPLWGF